MRLYITQWFVIQLFKNQRRGFFQNTTLCTIVPLTEEEVLSQSPLYCETKCFVDFSKSEGYETVTKKRHGVFSMQLFSFLLMKKLWCSVDKHRWCEMENTSELLCCKTHHTRKSQIKCEIFILSLMIESLGMGLFLLLCFQGQKKVQFQMHSLKNAWFLT